MDLKSFLQNLPTPLTDLLPQGAIGNLAKKHNYARQNISKMLRGEIGSDQSITEVATSAAEILQESSQKQSDMAGKIIEILQKQPETA